MSKPAIDRDVPSGVLLIKVAERRATLLGLNPMLGHAVHIVQHAPVKRTLAMELVELDELQAAFREKALAIDGAASNLGRSDFCEAGGLSALGQLERCTVPAQNRATEPPRP